MGNAKHEVIQSVPVKQETPKLLSSVLFNPETIITWAAAIVIAAISATVFLYTSFETIKDSEERNAQVEKHLDRIESKLDLLTLKVSGTK